VRRRACDKLLRVLQGEAHALSVAVLRELCAANMLAPLLQCARDDAVEKCREKALTMLLFFAERQALGHLDAVLRELVALLSSRMGKLPFAEPTEEIRLLLLQLFYAYVRQLSEQPAERLLLRDVITDIANVLAKTAQDPFPEVKKLTADLAIALARGWQRDVALQVGMIVRPMVTNLGHQHNRVRVGALQALEALVPCAAESLPELLKDVLLPAVGKVVFDRAASVRKQLVLTVATWLREIQDVRHYEPALLPFLLAGAVDESTEVAEVFHMSFGDLATKWQAANAANDDSAETEDEPMATERETQPPVYFPSRPPESARRLARRYETND
jgi:dynein assembly factor 5, axonemal